MGPPELGGEGRCDPGTGAAAGTQNPSAFQMAWVPQATTSAEKGLSYSTGP